MLKELQLLVLSWLQHLLWFPFFDTSAHLWDLRAEWNEQTELPDCTHFIYLPGVYDSVWQALASALLAG